VTLTVSDAAGNTDMATHTVTVEDVTSPTAEAGANRTVSVDTSISFDGSGSTDNVGVDSYDWDFGDSDGLSGLTATHTYTTLGTYTVTLTATDAASNQGTDTATIEVVESTSLIPDPGPDRTVDEDTSLSFDGSGSTDDGTIDSYAWDFGTGDTASGVTTTYAFADPGTYAVTLTVTDNDGNTASSEALVTVDDVTPPTADAGSDTTADEHTSVAFAPATATDNVGVVSAEWTFGDGNGSMTATTSHTYATPGTYTATLNLSDAAGNTAEDSRTVTVTDVTDPVAVTDATSSKTVPVGTAASFDGSGSTDNVGVDSTEWTFGDGATATGATPSHTYATPGTYTAALTVRDAAGNTDTETMTVYVSDVTDPVPDAGGDRTVTAGDSVTLDGSGSTDDVGVDSYTWHFADGTTAGGAAVTRTFGTAGSYSLTLTVRDGAGNRASTPFVVTAEAETASGTSGSGGGGGGGVPAPSETDETADEESDATPEGDVRTVSAETAVVAGEPVSVDFTTRTTAESGDPGGPPVDLTAIDFTPATSEQVSLQVTTGESLDGSPGFERDDNTALVTNVRVDHSIDNADVDDVALGFRVSNDRLAELGVPAEDIALYRYRGGAWAELPTDVVAEGDAAVTFRALSPGLSEFAVGAKQPKFALQTVRVEVDEIRAGDSLRVFVRITNDGGADGSFVANLLVDEAVVDSRELTIAAGGRRQVRFERPLEETGTYTVQVNDALAGEVIVTEATDLGSDTGPTTTPTTAVDSTADDGLTRILTGGVGSFGPLTVVGAIVVVVVYVRRRTD
jgi:PGF-pre-PGF domain-containing protein